MATRDDPSATATDLLLLVHILFMLRYAVLYYSGSVGGIDFNQE